MGGDSSLEISLIDY